MDITDLVEINCYQVDIDEDWVADIYPKPAFRLWCLGQNLEIAGALQAVKKLGWIRGWEAAMSVKSITKYGDAV